MFRSFAISSLACCLALSAVARTRPHYGGTLRIETVGDPWRAPDGIARKLVFDGLTSIDDGGAVQPGLAIRWESQNDDHRWQFWLRPGVSFHDGTPLTSHAVVASLSQSCASGCPWTGLHALGTSVVFTSESPMPGLPAELARSMFGIAGQRDAKAPVGTGPFSVAGTSNSVVSLAANDSYWQGRPFVDVVEVQGQRSLRDQWLDLSVGKADIVEVPPELLHQAQENRLMLLASQPADLLVLRVSSKGALADDHLRKAVALAVDRSALFNVIFQKQGEPTGSLLPDHLTGYAFLFPTDRDLAHAREERGGATATPLTIGLDNPDASSQLIAQRIALNLHEAGFSAQVKPASAKAGADLTLERIHLESADEGAGLREMLENFGQRSAEYNPSPAALYKEERDFLRTYDAIPLLYLPRAYAVSERVRDLVLTPDGIPVIANLSLEGTK
jgi:peptide/nickel transport system substrate-binding protein